MFKFDLKLGDLCTVKSSKRVYAKEYVKEGVPFFRSKDVINKALGSFQKYDLFISAERYKELREKTGSPKKDDLLINSVGNRTGHSYVVQDEGEFYFKDGNILWLSNFEGLNQYFLSYWLKSSIGQNVLESVMIGSAQKALTIEAVRDLRIPDINIENQGTIASVLGALDNKIENNRQMNETLEAIAQVIFKSWFVDFDPVHAKAAGKLPAYMNANTAELFPSSFGDDGLPVGFISKTLKDGDTEIESGKRPKGGIDKSLNEGIPSIGAESLQKIGDFEYSKVKYVAKVFAENSSKGWVQNYDIAIYKDGANVGDPTRVGLFGNGFPFDKFMVNEHVFLLRSKELGQPFLYSLCQSEKFSHQLKSMGTSKAAQPGLNQQEVLSCEYVAPPQVLLEAFNKLVSPFINYRLSLGSESQTLAELRNTLLPKLMSGEIRVKDAKREVEAAL